MPAAGRKISDCRIREAWRGPARPDPPPCPNPPVAKKDDPAFLYFPTNYRWSMGLLICLSGAPWTGVEIDEVNRVGRALTDKVGDDDAWFEEWARMGDKITARGRDAMRAGHKLTAAACFM